jgi:hypothetical protein
MLDRNLMWVEEAQQEMGLRMQQRAALKAGMVDRVGTLD